MKKNSLLIFSLIINQLLMAQSPLFIPDTLSGTNINLTLQNGTHQFFSGQATNTMGANGNILAPTLLLNQGDQVNFSVNNQIGETTTVHWHGLHVAPENDGGPHTTIANNTTWTPSFTIMDKAATYWYHPHLHHFTNKHVTNGIAGMIIVRDSEEQTLTLPRTYGVDDIPVIIQTKDFDANNQIIVESNSDDVLMVNATIDPYITVPAQVVRLRLLNGSSQRAYNLGLSNNQAFYQIASDGGLLNAPYQTTRLLLAPGERAEILINFNGMNSQTAYLKSYASELPNGIYGATNPGMGAGMTLNGYNPNPLNGSDFNILQFNISTPNANPITVIPTSLVNVTTLDEATANITRTLTFSPVSMGPNQLNGDFLINNSAFNMNVVNYTVPFNNTEIWQLTNQSGIAHPFHIHDVQFNILTRNGVAPQPNEQGRKDVVLVKPQETVRFIAKFEDFSNDNVPYMYHCHLLTHEDGGMMGQFVVSNPLLSVGEPIEPSLHIYPNPNQGVFFIEALKQIDEILIFDVLGRKVDASVLKISENKVRVSELGSGLYFAYFTSEGQKFSTKIIVKK